MKLPNSNELQTLSKANVSDPIVAGAASPNTSASAAGTAATAGKQAKMTIRLDSELHGKIRAAYLTEVVQGGPSTLSEWAARALEAAVKGSEETFNNGNPYTPVGTGVVPAFKMQ